MKIFKILQVSSDIWTNFFIFLLASGGGAVPPEPPTNPYFQNFLSFSLHYRETFDKICQKIAKFPLKFSKNYKSFIDFLTLLKIFEFEITRKFCFLHCKKYPHCSRDPPIREIHCKLLPLKCFPETKSCSRPCKGRYLQIR